MFDPVIEQVLGFLAMVLTGVIIAIATRVLKRLGISLDAEKQAQLEHYATQGVLKAKEIAAAQLKRSAVKLTSEDKQAIAIGHVLENVPRADEQQAIDVVTAVLPTVGEGASAGKV
jgi:hypothetical protein